MTDFKLITINWLVKSNDDDDNGDGNDDDNDGNDGVNDAMFRHSHSHKRKQLKLSSKQLKFDK